jgi:hypothetical protein
MKMVHSLSIDRVVKTLRFFAVAISLAASGCTSQQAYYSAQAWQRNECGKIADQGEYQRCMNKTNTSYEDYKHQTEGSRKQ